MATAFSRGGKEMTKAAMVGAVFGAYAGLKNGSGAEDEKVLNGIQASIAGAVAASTSKFIQDNLERDEWRAFAERKVT